LNKKLPELLAPAGTAESAWAALAYGADAVYAGLPRFSARAEAENFTVESLGEFVGYAHSLTPARRVYLTVNTLILNDELPALVEQLAEQQPWLVERTQYLSADKGYDSKENNQELWDRYGIKPVIDIRDTWQEERELPRSLYPQRVDTIFHTEGGEVLCRYQDTAVEADNYARMTFQGFEADRECLKYRCPAQAQGLTCTQRHLCYGAGEVGAYGRIVRIPLETERRTFTPVARASYAWEREYRHRTAVERVNSRLDTSFGYEQHFIRGLGKMRLRMDLTMLVMLAMAVGRIQAEQPEQLRSLVRPPARGQPRRAA